MIRQDCRAIQHGAQSYRCRQSIVWARERDHIRIIDGDKGTHWAIQETEATLWDLLVLSYPYPRVIVFLSALLNVSVEEAKDILAAVLASWQCKGILETLEKSRDGEPGNQHHL